MDAKYEHGVVGLTRIGISCASSSPSRRDSARGRPSGATGHLGRRL